MKSNVIFKTIIRRGQDGYWIASISALPGCHTQAKTYKVLKKRIHGAIKLYLEVARESRLAFIAA